MLSSAASQLPAPLQPSRELTVQVGRRVACQASKKSRRKGKKPSEQQKGGQEGTSFASPAAAAVEERPAPEAPAAHHSPTHSASSPAVPAQRQGEKEDTPVAPRSAVFTASAGTALAFGATAAALRSPALLTRLPWLAGRQPELDRLLLWPSPLDASHAAAALAAAALVTGVRPLLLAQWRALREASERSNRLSLTSLHPLDLIWLAVFSGASEEFLFRGALIPATSPDWRGVLAAGAVFGALHVTGNRNAAFAAWATGVGLLYGAAFLATGDLAVPIVAHALANLAAGLAWKQEQQQQQQQQGQQQGRQGRTQGR